MIRKTRSVKRGKCLWCGHKKYNHDGKTAQAVKAKPEFIGVSWTTTSCSVHSCAGCRTYET